ncbi:pirin family protein [Cellulophaga baltica]|uniref:pirin family protein n=1 Tax=Cellulophaga baltica TaxID=76594 RepID=UPI0004091BD3|nr:pirin family protein [Cellulophaga baltica]AIY14137.1 pirin [Cellulophaga baltica NN016038]
MSTIKSVFPLGFPWQTQDPFLFCVYHLDHYPEGNEEMGPKASLEGRTLGNNFTLKDGWRMYHGKTVPGFPAHPHRGFETITIVNKGYCDHSDSLGAAGRFGMGDVQWMTAGRGVQHSEMFPLLSTDTPNPLEMFQIWLNLPQKNKFVAPYFSMLWHEDIPIIKTESSSVKVVTGTYNEHAALDPAPNSWAADSANEVAIWNIHVDASSTFTLPKAQSDVTRTLYFYEGDRIVMDGQTITPNHGIIVDASEAIEIKVLGKNAHFLMLQGKPIKEPIAKYGPFVMNSDEEIQQAMQEYQLTQFGGWPWPQAAHVHYKSKGRFAKYPDGTIVEK